MIGTFKACFLLGSSVYRPATTTTTTAAAMKGSIHPQIMSAEDELLKIVPPVIKCCRVRDAQPCLVRKICCARDRSKSSLRDRRRNTQTLQHYYLTNSHGYKRGTALLFSGHLVGKSDCTVGKNVIQNFQKWSVPLHLHR